jgi:hypothetical protein
VSRFPSTPGECPLCGALVLFARTSKGALEALDIEPTDDGWILEQEGFTHVYEDHDQAVWHLIDQPWSIRSSSTSSTSAATS